MKNADVRETYEKHDGHLHLSSQIRMRFLSTRNLQRGATLEPSRGPLFATYELDRAIVTVCSTTNCADPLPAESGHVVLVLNVKCESNIFRFDPEH